MAEYDHIGLIPEENYGNVLNGRYTVVNKKGQDVTRGFIKGTEETLKIDG